jgi:hypothetical protein
MNSPKETFDEVWHHLRQGRGLSNTGDDPVYYLVFHPREILEVKRLLPEWRAKLERNGWKLKTLSMADCVLSIFGDHEFRDIWLESEANRSYQPESLDQIRETLADALTSEDRLQRMVLEKLQSLEGSENTVLMLTDLEALHPFLRVGVIEQKLSGKFTVPTVILYPGVRDGKTSLRFLGFYPSDGNYRSVHFGG